MERKRVYAIIDTERDYQNKMEKVEGSYVVPNQNTGDRLLSMQYNLNKAINAWYVEVNPFENTMEYVRKVAALCVKLMEENGAAERKAD